MSFRVEAEPRHESVVVTRKCPGDPRVSKQTATRQQIMMKVLKAVLWVVGTMTAVLAWSAFAVFVAFDGWWMDAKVPEGDHSAFLAQAKQDIAASQSANAAVVLIEAGAVVGAHYAQARQAKRKIDGDTVFPTASLSKWITALAVMTLVEAEKVELDEPVSKHLTRWRLPPGDFKDDDVTVRRLLSHTAGLTDELGFGDYRADEVLPSLEEALRNPRASAGKSAAIVVGAKPGGAFKYSGGGYLILQLLIEELTGQAYADYVRRAVLAPLGMERSSFDFIGHIPNATDSFDAAGRAAPAFQYAAAAATGFSSTAADLTRLAQAMGSSHPDLILTHAGHAAMRTPEASVFGSPIWGLGTMLYAPNGEGDFVFGHDGANEPAINAAVRINPSTGDAVVVLVNGHPSLASRIGADWVLWQTGRPDFLSTRPTLESAVVPVTIGTLLILVVIGTLAVRRRAWALPLKTA